MAAVLGFFFGATMAVPRLPCVALSASEKHFLTLKFVLGAATLLITLSFMSFLLFVVFHLSCYYGTHCSVISHSS